MSVALISHLYHCEISNLGDFCRKHWLMRQVSSISLHFMTRIFFTNNTIMNGKCQWVGISHYVNGVLCKMLLRVAVYCYFFCLYSTWQMQFTQHTKQVRIFNMLHNFIQKQLITFVSDIFLVILIIKSLCKTFVYNNNWSY
jgi:hypothetical protein